MDNDSGCAPSLRWSTSTGMWRVSWIVSNLVELSASTRCLHNFCTLSREYDLTCKWTKTGSHHREGREQNVCDYLYWTLSFLFLSMSISYLLSSLSRLPVFSPDLSSASFISFLFTISVSLPLLLSLVTHKRYYTFSNQNMKRPLTNQV